MNFKKPKMELTMKKVNIANGALIVMMLLPSLAQANLSEQGVEQRHRVQQNAVAFNTLQDCLRHYALLGVMPGLLMATCEKLMGVKPTLKAEVQSADHRRGEAVEEQQEFPAAQ